MLKNVICLLVVLTLYLPCQANTLKSSAPQIIISGQGIVKAQADVAYIMIGVENTEPSAAEAQKATARKMNKVMASLKKMGLAKDKVETSQVSLYPQYKYDKGKRNLTGYTARNEIKATIDQIEDIGRIIDNAIAAGANNINRVSFSIKNKTPVKKAALQKAFADAKGKAQVLAAASGLILSKIKRIQEAEARVISPVSRLKAFAVEQAGAAADTPIAPGKVEVRGNLTVVYECAIKK